jgi:hypothetical protein
MDKKEIYIENLEAQLREWSAKIDMLKIKADKVKAETKAEYDKHIAALRAKREVARQKLDEFKNKSGEAGDTLKTGIKNAWDDLHDALNAAIEKFR